MSSPSSKPLRSHPPDTCCVLLRKKLLDFIDRHASQLLISAPITRVELPVLKLLLCRSSLHIECETEVVAAVARWARAECRRRRQSETEVACRQVLAGAQYLVR